MDFLLKQAPEPRVLKSLWVVAAVTALIVALILFDGSANTAMSMLEFSMLALSAPSGPVASSAAAAFLRLLHGSPGLVFESGLVSMTIEWLVSAAAGYCQWFVCVPWLFRRLHR